MIQTSNLRKLGSMQKISHMYYVCFSFGLPEHDMYDVSTM